MVCEQLKCFHNLIKAVGGCVSLVWNVPSGPGETRIGRVDLTSCFDPIFAFTKPETRGGKQVWLPRKSLKW